MNNTTGNRDKWGENVSKKGSMCYWIWLFCVFGLTAQAQDDLAPASIDPAISITLDRTVYFSSLDGSEVVAAAGNYQVERAGVSELALIAETSGDRLVVSAANVSMPLTGDDLPSSAAFSEQDGENGQRVIFVTSGGEALIAVGRYSQVVARGSVVRQYSYSPTRIYSSARTKLSAQRPRVAYAIPKGPDLRITRVTGVPDRITGTEGFDPIFFATITVKNVGNEAAVIPSNTWLIGGPTQYTNISSSQITNERVNYTQVLRPGEERTETLAGKIRCFRGNPLNVKFEVDPQNRVAETQENNNAWTKQLVNAAVTNIDQKPDLMIETVRFSPANPDRYSRVMILVDMRNRGAGPAIFCPGDGIWMSNIEGQNGGGGGGGDRVVPAGQAYSGGVYIVDPLELESGCHRVFVTTDDRNNIEETNENNNTATGYLPIDGASCAELKAADRAQRITGVRVIKDAQRVFRPPSSTAIRIRPGD